MLYWDEKWSRKQEEPAFLPRLMPEGCRFLVRDWLIVVMESGWFLICSRRARPRGWIRGRRRVQHIGLRLYAHVEVRPQFFFTLLGDILPGFDGTVPQRLYICARLLARLGSGEHDRRHADRRADEQPADEIPKTTHPDLPYGLLDILAQP
jgi:hypothetical protein